ncbi:hypothetical protein [Flagellimonas sp.]|uniref:hypothetical protein n=1 Tax=Flagellimonas sp. TaxID=2058762 RepID=UPI003BA884F5
MTIFRMLLKVLAHFRLLSTEERQTLAADISHWEENAKTEKDKKLNALYLKLHEGVLMRLLLPFGFFFLVRMLNDWITVDDDPFEED